MPDVVDESEEDLAITVQESIEELNRTKDAYPKLWCVMSHRDFVHYFNRHKFTEEEQKQIIVAVGVAPKRQFSPEELPDPPKVMSSFLGGHAEASLDT